MYKCSECGTEYEIKPDYCDCGNDIFQIVIKKEEPEQKTKTQQEIKQTHNIPKLQPPKKKKTEGINPLSFCIFIFCLILSFVIIFFIGNPKTEVAKDGSKPEKINKNIPPIDSFWDNTTIGIELDNHPAPVLQEESQIQNKTQAQIQPSEPKVIIQPQIVYVHDAPAANQSKTITSKPQQTQAKQVQVKTTSVNTTTPENAKSNQPVKVNTPQLVTPKQNTNTISNITKNPVQTASPTIIPKQTTQITTNITTKPISSNTSVLPSAPQPATTSQATNALNAAAAKQELANYKVSLRNVIGKKIDFASVVGDGDCAITFKVNNNGQLTNRTFAKQSSNITLNDAVYKAMMSTPSYNPPPKAYNNETLRLNVRFYNGNFEIKLN
ncbi:hypothetical protein IJ579_01755 [bacterium]|nr:hypothetical protein [bacterium]